MVRSKTSTSKLARRAIGYARVSTDKQKNDGNSIDVQKNAIRNYVEKNGLSLIDIIDESKSASKLKLSSSIDLLTDRPRLQEILDKAKRHEFTDLILYSRDRLARDFYESLVLKSLFIKARVTIHYVTTSEKLSDTNEYIDKFTDLVFSNIAMLEAGLIGQRAKSGQKINIQSGYYAGGHVPYGYNLKSVYDKKKKTFIKDSSKEIVIKRIFALYNLRFSYSEMIKILKKEFPSEIDISFTKSTLSQIINNEVYTGIMIWNRKSKHQLGENDTTVRSSEKETMKMVSSDLYNKVSEIKTLKRGSNNLSYKSNFLLKGKLICGSCGKAFKAKNNGKGKVNVYYCTCDNEKSTTKTRWSICIPQKSLEQYVFSLIHNNLEKLLKDATLLKKYHIFYLNIIEKEKSDACKYINVLKAEIDEIEYTLDSANKTINNELWLKKEDDMLYGENFFEAIRNTISLINIRKNELEKQISETRKIVKFEAMNFEKFTLRFKNILSSLIEINSLGTKEFSPPLSSIQLKRMLLDDVLDKIVVNSSVYGETLSVYLKIPDISDEHNFEFLKTCPINSIFTI